MKIVIPRPVLRSALWVIGVLGLFMLASSVIGKWYLIPTCFGDTEKSTLLFCEQFRNHALQSTLMLVESKWDTPHEVSEKVTLTARHFEGKTFVFEYSAAVVSTNEAGRTDIFSDLQEWVCQVRSGAKFVAVIQGLPNEQIVKFSDQTHFSSSFSASVCEELTKASWKKVDAQG